ncbi:MAG: zf-HC2 domain-containing protein [Streptosporangiaceae bacterium]
MSEMSEMSCREFQDAAAELALGVLTGRERAQAMAHLDHCEACRESVRQLTLTGEGLLGLLPSIEPPAGFETRVLDRIGLTAPAPAPSPARWTSWLSARRADRAGSGQLSRTRRALAVAAVAVAVVAGGLGGWGLHNGTSAPAPAALDSAALVSVSHQSVGKIFVYRGHPQWVYMSVNTSSGNGTVICQVENRDGHFSTVGSFHLTNGYGYWGSPAPGNPGSLAGARLITPTGHVLATATFR